MRGLFTFQPPPKSPVGASLLAKAVSQLTYSSTDTTPSRAGSLPQEISARCLVPTTCADDNRIRSRSA
ncbi:hypothetical protein PkP19E3_06120 [Pseudomonas koreensis]|nr:hypothetical protein PkP19E3_06120 [Pseudomonas koreensis]